jgi:hypothetical protein
MHTIPLKKLMTHEKQKNKERQEAEFKKRLGGWDEHTLLFPNENTKVLFCIVLFCFVLFYFILFYFVLFFPLY